MTYRVCSNSRSYVNRTESLSLAQEVLVSDILTQLCLSARQPNCAFPADFACEQPNSLRHHAPGLYPVAKHAAENAREWGRQGERRKNNETSPLTRRTDPHTVR